MAQIYLSEALFSGRSTLLESLTGLERRYHTLFTKTNTLFLKGTLPLELGTFSLIFHVYRISRKKRLPKFGIYP